MDAEGHHSRSGPPPLPRPSSPQLSPASVHRGSKPSRASSGEVGYVQAAPVGVAPEIHSPANAQRRPTAKVASEAHHATPCRAAPPLFPSPLGRLERSNASTGSVPSHFLRPHGTGTHAHPGSPPRPIKSPFRQFSQPTNHTLTISGAYPQHTLTAAAPFSRWPHRTLVTSR